MMMMKSRFKLDVYRLMMSDFGFWIGQLYQSVESNCLSLNSSIQTCDFLIPTLPIMSVSPFLSQVFVLSLSSVEKYKFPIQPNTNVQNRTNGRFWRQKNDTMIQWYNDTMIRVIRVIQWYSGTKLIGQIEIFSILH